jgi:hypothetical protein
VSDRANPRIGVFDKSIVRVLGAVGAARTSGAANMINVPSNETDVTLRHHSSDSLRSLNTFTLPTERWFNVPLSHSTGNAVGT